MQAREVLSKVRKVDLTGGGYRVKNYRRVAVAPKGHSFFVREKEIRAPSGRPLRGRGIMRLRANVALVCLAWVRRAASSRTGRRWRAARRACRARRCGLR